LRQVDLIMTKVGKWSDRSESIIPVCTGILMLLVYIWYTRVALWSVILIGLVISCVQFKQALNWYSFLLAVSFHAAANLC